MTYYGLFILLILVLLSIACGETANICGRNYKIIVGSKSYCCDSYRWVGSDLHLDGCSSGSHVIVNASNVSIKKYTK